MKISYTFRLYYKGALVARHHKVFDVFLLDAALTLAEKHSALFTMLPDDCFGGWSDTDVQERDGYSACSIKRTALFENYHANQVLRWKNKKHG